MEGVSRFEDLVAWQLAVALQRFADNVCERPVVKRNRKFQIQLSDSAASGPRNIAEGFGRYYHPEFAQFARTARGSEGEVINHLRDAHRKRYMTRDELERGLHAAREALKAVNGLIRYLESTPDFGRE